MYEGSLCVCCMSTDDLVELFVSRIVNNVEENYAKMLSSCLDKQISETEGHESICESCTSKLRDCVTFRQQTLKTMSILSSVSISQPPTPASTKVLQLGAHKKDKIMIVEIERLNIEEYLCNNVDSEKNPLQKDLNANIKEKALEVNGNEKALRKRGRPVSYPPDNVPYRISNDELMCRECGEKFPNNVTLKVHYNTHFGAHACQSCGKSFMKRKSLKKHESSHLTGPFVCATCGQVYRNINSLHSHARYKHGARAPFACSACAARFATRAQRMAHAAAAHGLTERRYPCRYCDKRYRHSGERAQHISTTHEVKLFPCPLCGAEYHRGYLRAHMLRRHGAGRGLACTVCLARHPSRSALAKHMLSHFDDRRFVCKLCSQAFVQKCSLKYHVGSHVRRGEYRGDPDYLMVYKHDPDAKYTGLLSEKESEDEQYLDESLLSEPSAKDEAKDEDHSTEIQSFELNDDIEGIEGMLLDDDQFQLPSDL